ncbi:MAG: deoxyribose-phosphate aldolase [Legionellales bacterium]
MSLEKDLNDLLQTVLTSNIQSSCTAMQLIGCMDLTLLDAHASLEAIQQAQMQALTYKTAAICLYAQHIALLAPIPEALTVATVINFPNADQEADFCIQDIHNAVQQGVHEIDYVFPYQSYLSGNKTFALGHYKAIAEACSEQDLRLKIILETGAFPDMHTIYQASRELIPLGCSFLKTSTGKNKEGATFASVFAIVSAIKDSKTQCGLKVSGGIKTAEQAFAYARLGELVLEKPCDKSWFRIGASSLLKELAKYKT